ncbi:MAG: 4-hydroxyphenylpyruvate dioxygenase [Acidimicrobiia bacterium]|nr:4-hydroxyphenylpyruvate dioxygenase [Acidimicrobiia bacterium]NNF64829.1 4-hydroxyphenylpyruvate dioxygenase [Acidimicrobiia bacterium]
MPILGYDAIEFWVGNARQAAHYYRTAFGFNVVAYAGPETGVRDRASYVLEQGAIRFVMTAGLGPDSPIVRHQALHGDGVRDVAFSVPNAEEAHATAVSRGATSWRAPESLEDDNGKLVVASVHAYGDTIHTFVDRSNYSGAYAPGYKKTRHWLPADSTGLRLVDHVVCNVELGTMDEWADYYASILGFSQLHHFNDDQISTEYTALMSKVLWDGEGRIKLPINEPAEGLKKSQIEEYLDFYGSAGVQHMALATDDIVSTVSALRANGVRFLSTPQSYYDDLRSRLDWTKIDADIEQLAKLGILVDQDDEGYLLQIFTKAVQDRPTVFYEVIERHGSRGFGVGNFQALFEAIERDQELRGNL